MNQRSSSCVRRNNPLESTFEFVWMKRQRYRFNAAVESHLIVTWELTVGLNRWPLNCFKVAETSRMNRMGRWNRTRNATKSDERNRIKADDDDDDDGDDEGETRRGAHFLVSGGINRSRPFKKRFGVDDVVKLPAVHLHKQGMMEMKNNHGKSWEIPAFTSPLTDMTNWLTSCCSSSSSSSSSFSSSSSSSSCSLSSSCGTFEWNTPTKVAVKTNANALET